LAGGLKEGELLLFEEDERLPKASEMLRTLPEGSRDDFIEVSYFTALETTIVGH
jgi:hypothetical protein